MDTGTGEDEHSDQFYEIMESPALPLVMTKVNNALCSSKEKMMRDEQTLYVAICYNGVAIYLILTL